MVVLFYSKAKGRNIYKYTRTPRESMAMIYVIQTKPDSHKNVQFVTDEQGMASSTSRFVFVCFLAKK